jgi:two-component system, sensor histidine kinase and response regulator
VTEIPDPLAAVVEPLPVPAPASPVAVAEVPPRPGAGHILIVEDNPVNQIVAARVVNGLGYAAHVASGGQAALEAFERQRFDAILMDLQMPDMDGYATSTALRRCEGVRSTRTPIIAMTANFADGDQQRCLAAGMDDYLSKPIHLADLRSTLARWIGAGQPLNRPVGTAAASLAPASTTPSDPATGR